MYIPFWPIDSEWKIIIENVLCIHMIFISFRDISKTIMSVFASPEPLVNYQHNNKKILCSVTTLLSYKYIMNSSLTLQLPHGKWHLFFRPVCRRRPHDGFLEVIRNFQCSSSRLCVDSQTGEYSPVAEFDFVSAYWKKSWKAFASCPCSLPFTLGKILSMKTGEPVIVEGQGSLKSPQEICVLKGFWSNFFTWCLRCYIVLHAGCHPYWRKYNTKAQLKKQAFLGNISLSFLLVCKQEREQEEVKLLEFWLKLVWLLVWMKTLWTFMLNWMKWFPRNDDT